MFRTFRIKRRVHKAVPNLDYKIVGIHVRRVKGSLLRGALRGITAELVAGFAVISLIDTETIKPAQLSRYGQLLERETTSLHSAPIQHEYFELFHARYPARGTCVKQLSGTCNAVRNAT